jgi:hypothetical protein
VAARAKGVIPPLPPRWLVERSPSVHACLPRVAIVRARVRTWPDRLLDHAGGVVTEKRLAVAIASTSFFGWLIVLYAVADHPPPPRFLVLVPILVAAATPVYRRVPAYARWSRVRRPRRWLLAALDGAGAVLIAASLTSVLPFAGEPTVPRSAPATVIWFAVLACVGAGNGLLIYGFTAACAKRL